METDFFFPSIFTPYNTCPLILKMPRKPASENVVGVCHLLNIFANFSNLFLHTSKQSRP